LKLLQTENPTREQAREIIARLQARLMSQKIIAVFKKPYDNGVEATLPAVLVGRSMTEYLNKEETLKKRINDWYPNVKISLPPKPECHKGRLESFISFYVKYGD